MAQPAVDTIAFAKPGGESLPPSGGRPIDLVHLARQTFGDRGLEAEILSMFLAQSQGTKARLRAATVSERQLLAHGLKGSARSIGAFPLGDAAAIVELQPGNALHLRELERRIDDVADFIASITR